MRKKILIADDEPNIVVSLEFLMRRRGYEVKSVGSGEEALQALDGFVADLILLDVMMPRMNGYEVCQRLRADPARQGIRIVMLTAKGRDVEITKGMAVGADAYVTKPFSTQELVATVQRLIGD